ncbi:MAG: hypothetical protein GEU92_04535 [Alphaproteobacteria bacterium]|nr:hypothetical protein [Alphaproteobacteria bacterium]
MTSGKAILLGSVVLGVAIVAAAFVWRAPMPAAGPETTASAPATRPAETPGRYQIVKVENGVSWRLDTATGEMTACRVDGDHMLCARSTEATELPKVSAEALEAQRRAREKARDEEKTAILDRFLAFFKWVVEQARAADRPADAAPPAPSPGDGAAPRTL